MMSETVYVLFLDDYHAGDVLFLQGLARAMARRTWKPAPVIVHGSGEHAERLLEAHGIFRRRTGGVLEIESASEHTLVEQALRSLNQKIVALLTDAVVSTVGVIGAQRNVFAIADGQLCARGATWLYGIARQGVVPVVAANARDETSGATGEVALTQAVESLAAGLSRSAEGVEIVAFTRTNLPGIMRKGSPRSQVDVSEPVLRESVPDWESLADLVTAGYPVLLTNSNRLADSGGPSGSHVVSGD